MTFACVSSQGALLRPCSPSSSRSRTSSSRNHHLQFHFKDPSAVKLALGSYITLAQTPTSSQLASAYYTSQLIFPQYYITSSSRSGIPRSSSGLHSFASARPSPAIVLHPLSFAKSNLSTPAPPPPQSILVLPGSARSRIRQHQAREESARRLSAGNPTEFPTENVRTLPVKIEESMAATAVHLSSPPPSSTSTPHHVHHHIAPAGYHHYQGFYTETNDRGSPTVVVTEVNNHIHHSENFTPTRVTAGYPGGAVGHNPVIIRVVQKPVESLMVDGDNPFRPDSELYKEADQLIKVYTQPRGSQSPSPLPISSGTSADEDSSSQFPQLADSTQEKIAVEGKEGRSTTLTSSSSSSSPSIVVEAKEKDHDHRDKEEQQQQRQRGQSEETDSSLEDQRAKDKHSTSDKSKETGGKKKEKKKRKPVGCGGDKRCSVM